MNVASPSDTRPVALITGRRGFTGRYMSAELEAAGYRVIGMSHEGSDEDIVCDLRSRDEVVAAVSGLSPEIVIHLAAIAFVAHGDADAMYRTNVVGTRNLLEGIVASGNMPKTVFLASSANVYGNNDVPVLDESARPAPANDYAVSKLSMEYMADLWRDRLPLIIARPFNYTGVGQAANFLLPKIVDHFRRRERVIELGNIDVARDFQDVRFVADAYRRLVQVGPVSGVVNVCSGVAHSLMDVVRLMQDIAGYEIDVRVNPQFVRPGEVARLTGSNDRLRSLVGQLDIIPLRQTLEWMYADR